MAGIARAKAAGVKMATPYTLKPCTFCERLYEEKKHWLTNGRPTLGDTTHKKIARERQPTTQKRPSPIAKTTTIFNSDKFTNPSKAVIQVKG